MIRFLCPRCHVVLQVPAAWAGASVGCSRCLQRLRVPALASTPPPPPLPAPAFRPRQSSLELVLAGAGLLCVLAGLTVGAAYLAWDQGRAAPHREQTRADGPDDKATPKDRPAAGPPDREQPAPRDEGTSRPAPRDDDADQLVGKVLALINLRRGQAGVAALSLDERHSRACREHALYLAKNLPSRPDLDPHGQEADLPGASAAGAAVAARASVRTGDPLEVARGWLDAPIHRELLLDRGLGSLGAGLARREAGGWLVVLDFLGGRTARGVPGKGAAQAVLFPVHQQTETPLTFPGNEVPDPLPAATDKLAGYPITATFPAQTRVTVARARLEDEDGQEVPIWFSSPEKPANDRHPRTQQNSLCLFARQPLRPGMRYLVRLQARAGNQDWSRTWTFATLSAEKKAQMYQRALARINEVRKFAGLGPLRLDPARSAACLRHADYLARHLDRVPGLNVLDEREDLAGFTAAGRDVARRSAIRLGGGTSPNDAVDWMLSSVLNRHVLLNPATDTVGLGAAQQAPRGWVWVIGLPSTWRREADCPAVLYPGKDQKDVPLYFGRELGEMVSGQPRDHAAGFAVTANFFPGTRVRKVSAQLLAPGGTEVPCWLSTPEKPLPETGAYTQVLLVPRNPLAPASTYTARMSAEIDGKPWSENWSFTTLDVDRYRARVAGLLLERINQARKLARLGPLTADDRLSQGCLAHARYVARNLGHPRLQGLGIHDEDATLPGATPHGARAGKAAIIALLPDPLESVDGWLATLYHRIPLLDPNLRRIGYGQEQHPLRGWVAVLDVGNGR